MKSTKSLTSAIVATALVGALGVAYAQGTGGSNNAQGGTNSQLSDPLANTAQPPATGPAQPANNATGNSTMGTMGSSSMGSTGSTTTNDTAAFNTERPAQADRN